MKTKLLFLIIFTTLLSIKSFAQPSNDACIGAINLPVNGTCINTVVTIDATATDSGLADPGCANYMGGDLWYSLTMPASGIVSIVASTNGSLTNVGMAVYKGSDCVSLTKLSCAFDNGVGSFPEATISQTTGTTLYIRVWEEGNDALGTFNLCASEVLTAPPANNDCSGAISLTVGAVDTCSNTLVTIDGTETDSGLGDPECSSYVGGDLWYKFTVPVSGSVAIVTETDASSSITNGGMAVYTGSDCNSLTLYECDSDSNTASSEFFERINIYGQAAASTVYVRVWSYNNAQTGTFNICAFEISTPPAATNDDCVDAIALTLGATCSPVLVSNYLATSSEIADPSITDPGCAFYNGDDIWYKVTVPASGRFEIETYESDNSILDGGMAIYSGDCAPNNLALIECNDDGGIITTQSFERIELSGRTPGETLFVRVWAFGNKKTGTFNICAVELAPLDSKSVIADNFKIYPNPSKGNINIKLKTGNNFIGDIKVFDLSGKLMLKDNNFNGQLDVSKLSKGIYLMSLREDEKMVTKKLIIK